MQYSERIPVLNSEIPMGGFGRHLTSAECRAIRAHGLTCSTRWIVVRAYDSPTNGIVYKPSKFSGYDHSDIYVTTKD